MTDSIAVRLAMPGDPDLDADVDGLTVTAVAANTPTRELLVYLADGFGRMVDTASGRMRHFPAGDPDARVEHVELAAVLPDMPDRAWADYVATLERWRDTRTLLRMCCAPGRVTLLIEDRSTFLPFPRRPEPA